MNNKVTNEAFQFLCYRPHVGLRQHIKNYLFIRKPGLFKHDRLLLPDTEYMLAINLGNLVTIRRVDGVSYCHQPFSTLLFSHYDKCFRFETTNMIYLVIHFYPPGLYHFLKQSLSSIPLNSFLEMTSLAGLSTQQIVEYANSDEKSSKIIDLIDQWLLKCFSVVNNQGDVLWSAFKLLNQHHCHLSIEFISKQSCSTYRQLDRKFSEQVGFSPKQYAQIVRFRKAYDQLMNHRKGNMIQIVVEHNYYDQMHLIKDFKKFTCCTPTRLLMQDKDSIGNFHMLYANLCNQHSLS